jgi:hypothetical protein
MASSDMVLKLEVDKDSIAAMDALTVQLKRRKLLDLTIIAMCIASLFMSAYSVFK